MDNVAFAVVFVRINDPAPAIARNSAAIAPRPPAAQSLSAMISQYFIAGLMVDSASRVQQRVNDYRNPAVFGILILARRGSGVQALLSRKRMSISRTVSDLTGKSQSAGVEKQPGVEHLICKARKPLVPPTTSIWRPEITFLQMVQ